MKDGLEKLDAGLQKNLMSGSQRRVTVGSEPISLSPIKSEILRRWPLTSLLDIFKETDLRVGFTEKLLYAKR